MDTGTVTQTAGQEAADFLTVLFAWMFTPTGAVLTLLLLAVGGGSVFMKIMGRSMRMLSVAARICAGLFFVWVISGVWRRWAFPSVNGCRGSLVSSRIWACCSKRFWRGCCLRHPKIFAKNCGNAGMVWQMNAEVFFLPDHSRIVLFSC